MCFSQLIFILHTHGKLNEQNELKSLKSSIDLIHYLLESNTKEKDQQMPIRRVDEIDKI